MILDHYLMHENMNDIDMVITIPINLENEMYIFYCNKHIGLGF